MENLMNNNFKNNLYELLKKDSRLWDEGKKELNETLLEDLADKLDEQLLNLLLSNKQTKEKFFLKAKDVFVFKVNDFKFFIDESKLDNSYTQYKNRIGLRAGNKLLSERDEVVLDWPFKDCVLEGGMTKEDQKRNEIFFNEVLAKDEIDRLFDPKALVSWKRYTVKGEEKVKELKRDKDGIIRENLIIKGNNLLALHSLKEQFTGKVKLIYIDPPYNTGNDSFRYNDAFNHSTWLTFMKNRLEVARDLLREDGVIFIQCDDNEQAYLKVLMDQLFGKDNFVNCIAVKMAEPTGVKMAHAEIRFPKIKEYLLFYKNKYLKFENIDKTQKSKWDKEYKLFLENLTIEERNNLKEIQSKNKENEEDVDIAMKLLSRVKIVTVLDKLNDLKIPKDEQDEWKFENAWRIIQTVSSDSIRNFVKNLKTLPSQDIGVGLSKEKKMFFYNPKANLNAAGRIRVTFADDFLEVNPCDFWQDIKTTGIAKEGNVALKYGKKPEKLIYRIIYMTTNQNDLILDFQLGSGTTCAVAHKMGRQYIGIEQLDYGKNDSIIRLQKVINSDSSGVSKTVNWQGGGDFVHAELAKWNEEAKEKILKCENSKELIALFDELYEKYFLNYTVKVKDFREKVVKEEEFKNLPLEKQKTIFVEMLDMNQLYVNYSEREDKKYGLSKEDITLTEKFYNQE